MMLDTHYLTQRTGPFAAPHLDPGPAVDAALAGCRVLVIGAGGLGCEILKDLALSGFTDIHVIDLDTIDLSNLNRQFLFRQKDIGRPKAEVAAAFVNARVPRATVTPYFGKIQDMDDEFYQQFNIVISGLDSIEARRWINAKLVQLVEVDEDGDMDHSTIIPFIDGGTEGFKGQVRNIIPRMSACFECALDTFPPQTVFPLCTIANTPRRPEHCIQWASELEWKRVRAGETLDKDNPDHLKWLYETALARADKFGIAGVTYRSTMGVVKNIIPAIASTNAMISAACVNEAFKLATNTCALLNNYMTYNGNEGTYTYAFEYERKPNCMVCGAERVVWTVEPTTTVLALLERLKEEHKLRDPSLRTEGKSIYMTGVLAEQTKPNLAKAISEFVNSGDELAVTDRALPSDVAFHLTIKWCK